MPPGLVSNGGRLSKSSEASPLEYTENEPSSFFLNYLLSSNLRKKLFVIPRL